MTNEQIETILEQHQISLQVMNDRLERLRETTVKMADLLVNLTQGLEKVGILRQKEPTGMVN